MGAKVCILEITRTLFLALNAQLVSLGCSSNLLLSLALP